MNKSNNVVNIFNVFKSIPSSEFSSILKIIEEVCDYYGVTKEALTSKRRSRYLAGARSVCQYIFRKFTELSYSELGVIFNCDHSTVVYNCNKVNLLIKNSESLNRTIDQLFNRLNTMEINHAI